MDATDDFEAIAADGQSDVGSGVAPRAAAVTAITANAAAAVYQAVTVAEWELLKLSA